LGERLDRRDALGDLVVGEAEEPRVVGDVLATGEERVEPGAELEEARDAALEGDRAGARLHGAGDDLEERRLAGTVYADDAGRGARRNRERDVAQRMEGGGCTVPPAGDPAGEAVERVAVEEERLAEAADGDAGRLRGVRGLGLARRCGRRRGSCREWR